MPAASAATIKLNRRGQSAARRRCRAERGSQEARSARTATKTISAAITATSARASLASAGPVLPAIAHPSANVARISTPRRRNAVSRCWHCGSTLMMLIFLRHT